MNYIRNKNSENVLQSPHNINFLKKNIGVVFKNGAIAPKRNLITLKPTISFLNSWLRNESPVEKMLSNFFGEYITDFFLKLTIKIFEIHPFF